MRFLAFERKKIEKYWEDNVKGKMNKDSFRKCTSLINKDMLETVCGDYDKFIKQSIGLESRKFTPKLKHFEQSM